MASLEGPRDEEDHVMSVSPCASCIGRSSEFKWGACTLPNAANAALIAAAPDLLAALNDLLDEQNDAPLETRRKEWEAAMEKARAAIENAEKTKQ